MLNQRKLKQRWKKFLLSENFQFMKTKKCRFCLESEFSRIFIELDYAPMMHFYAPECTITLCELGYNTIDVIDSMDNSQPQFYNLMNFRIPSLTKIIIDDAVPFIQGNEGLYSEEEFETLLDQLHLYAFPLIRKCQTRNGFIEFCKKYQPDKLGFVYRSMGEWIKKNVPETSCSWNVGWPDDSLSKKEKLKSIKKRIFVSGTVVHCPVPVQRESDAVKTEVKTPKSDQK